MDKAEARRVWVWCRRGVVGGSPSRMPGETDCWVGGYDRSARFGQAMGSESPTSGNLRSREGIAGIGAEDEGLAPSAAFWSPRMGCRHKKAGVAPAV